MHAVFIAYGHRLWVEHFLRDMESQSFLLPLTSPLGEEKKLWIKGQVRVLPLGIYEYIFPKEFVNEVLTSLNFGKSGKVRGEYEDRKDRYDIGKLRFFLIRKFFKFEKIPKINTDKRMLWENNRSVEIIPLGVRYDPNKISKEGNEWDGWTHEAL